MLLIGSLGIFRDEGPNHPFGDGVALMKLSQGDFVYGNSGNFNGAVAVARDGELAEVRPMPVVDQMRRQWEFVCAAIETVISNQFEKPQRGAVR